MKMNEYTISVRKQFNELKYEPFSVEVSKKFNAETKKEVADEELKLEKFIDEVIARREKLIDDKIAKGEIKVDE